MNRGNITITATPTIRDPGKCPYFSKEIVHANQHDLTINFVRAMKNDEYLFVFKKDEIRYAHEIMRIQKSIISMGYDLKRPFTMISEVS